MDHESDSTKWLAAAFVLLILAILALLPWHNMESADNSLPAVANVCDNPGVDNQRDLDRATASSHDLKDGSEESTLPSVSTSELAVVHGLPRLTSITEELCQPNAPPPKARAEGKVDVRRIDSATESDDNLSSSDLTGNHSGTEDHVQEIAAHLQIPDPANAGVVHADAEFCSANSTDGRVRVTPFMQDMEYSPFALQFAAQDTGQVSDISSMGFTPFIIEESGCTKIGQDLLHRNDLILCSGIRSWGMAQPVVVSELPCKLGSDEEADDSVVGLALGYQALSRKAETEPVPDVVNEKSDIEEPSSVSEKESQFGTRPDALTVATPPVEIESFWEGVDESRESEFALLAAPLNPTQETLTANPPRTPDVDSSVITLSKPLGPSIESSGLRSPGSEAVEASGKKDEPHAFLAASMATPMLQETLPAPLTDSDQPAIADEEEDVDESDREEDTAEETAEKTDATGDDKPDDDKKMLGHLAGKFGYCFRSALSCGFYFGNEFTFLGVESPGYTRVSLTDSVNDRVDQFTGDDAFGFGNRLTLGLRAKNIGFRAIYWAFAAENSSHDALNDIDRAPDFSTSSTARLETFDFDLTQNYCIMGCNLTSSCGFRFAEFQGSELTHLAGGISDLLQATASTLSHKSMRGLGPSFSMELRKTIPWCLGSPAYMPRGQFDPGCAGCFGCCGSDCNSYGACGGCGGCDSCGLGSPCFPWRVYFNTRISLLWADTYSESITDSVMATGPGVVTQGIARSRDFASLSEEEKATLLSTQLQVGLEYQQPVFCNSALFKMRFGLEFQTWNLGESASMSESFAFLTDPNGSFDGRVDTLSRSDNEYIDLFGFTFLLGLNY
ncbi:MAG: hypothetical protein ACPGLY_25010 [Rubripirellula sp.]